MDLAFRLCLNRPMAQEAPSFSPLYKQIKPKLWIMRLDSRGPIAMHVSNLDVLPTANTNDEEVNHETMA